MAHFSKKQKQMSSHAVNTVTSPKSEYKFPDQEFQAFYAICLHFNIWFDYFARQRFFVCASQNKILSPMRKPFGKNTRPPERSSCSMIKY